MSETGPPLKTFAEMSAEEFLAELERVAPDLAEAVELRDGGHS